MGTGCLTYARWIALVGAAGALTAALSGCGVIPALAGRTTSAALAPVVNTANATAAAARATAANLQIVERTVARTTNTLARGTVQTAQSLERTAAIAAARRAAVARPVAAPMRAPASPSPTQAKNNRPSKPAAPPQPELTILPATTLAQLTPQQAELQKAAQAEAFTAPVGEVIYWEIDGRAGTASAESEKPIGSFTCRTFVQTVTIDGKVEGDSAIACHTGDGAWTMSF